MPLKHQRPSHKYMRELKAVARAAGGLNGHLSKVNLLPDDFPIEQVENFCAALVGLPKGTAEGSIGPLRAADSELNRVRQKFIPAHDEETGDDEPLVPRGSDFDLRLVNLMAAIRAAIEQYKLESGDEFDTDVTADQAPDEKAEDAIAAAIGATDQTSQQAAELKTEIDEFDNDQFDKEFAVEIMLASDLGVQAKSSKASLQTKSPRQTVIDWLADSVENTAAQLDDILAQNREKIDASLNEFGETARSIFNRHFPGLVELSNDLKNFLHKLSVIWSKGDGGQEAEIGEFDYVEVYSRLLRGETIPESWVPNVTVLDFENSNFHHLGDDKLTQISGDPRSFSDCQLLSNLSDLSILNLSDTAVSDISVLSNLTKLQVLTLKNTTVSEISALSVLHNLVFLNLEGASIPDISAFSGLVSLDTLNLSKTNVSDISAFSGLVSLDTLNLSNTNVSDISVLSGLTSLGSLYLHNTAVSDISALSGLTNLDSLDLSNTKVSDISGLSGLTKLKDLFLNNTNVSEISAFSGLINMKSLDLEGANVSEISALSGLTKLEILDLGGTNVSDISALSGLNNLRDLWLAGTKVKDTSVLDHLKNLTIYTD